MSDKGRQVVDEALGLLLHGDLTRGRERLFSLVEEDPEEASRIFLAGLLFCQEGESGRTRLLQRLAPGGAHAILLRALSGLAPPRQEVLGRLEVFLERIVARRKQVETADPDLSLREKEGSLTRLAAFHQKILARMTPEKVKDADQTEVIARLTAFHQNILARMTPEEVKDADQTEVIARLAAFHQKILARMTPEKVKDADQTEVIARLSAFHQKILARLQPVADIEMGGEDLPGEQSFSGRVQQEKTLAKLVDFHQKILSRQEKAATLERLMHFHRLLCQRVAGITC